MEIIFLTVFFVFLIASNFSFFLPLYGAIFICILSLFMLIIKLIKKDSYPLPLYPFLSLLIVSFTFLLGIIINSVDLLQGYNALFLWSSYTFLFLVSSLIPISEKRILQGIVLFVFTCLILYLMRAIFPAHFAFLLETDRQFILPSTGMHNHLGDILGLGLIGVLLLTNSSHVASVARLILLPLIVLSFTKSALFALLVVLILAGAFIKEKRGHLLYTAFILFYISVAAILVFSQEFSSLSFVAPVQKYLQEGFNLTPKPLLSQRDVYSYQATSFLLNSSFEYMGFGVGLGNFSYIASKTTTAPHIIIADPHNIFLTYFAEGGIISLLWIGVFFATVCYYGITYKKNIFFLFLYILILFQTDYLYKIPAIMFLFFFLAGQVVQKGLPSDKKSDHHAIHMGVGVFMTIFIIFTGSMLYFTHTQNIYHQSALEHAIKTNKKNDIDVSANTLLSITPYDETLLVRLSSIYEAFNQKERAVALLERLLTFHPHSFVENFTHIVSLKTEIKQDVHVFLVKTTPELKKALLSSQEKQAVNKICKEHIKKPCL